MLKHFKTRIIITYLLLLLAVPVLGANDKPPVFYFGGKAIFVGMLQAEALSALSKCCKLSPSSLTEAQQEASAKFGTMAGQFILKEKKWRRLDTTDTRQHLFQEWKSIQCYPPPR